MAIQGVLCRSRYQGQVQVITPHFAGCNYLSLTMMSASETTLMNGTCTRHRTSDASASCSSFVILLWLKVSTDFTHILQGYSINTDVTPVSMDGPWIAKVTNVTISIFICSSFISQVFMIYSTRFDNIFSRRKCIANYKALLSWLARNFVSNVINTTDM